MIYELTYQSQTCVPNTKDTGHRMFWQEKHYRFQNETDRGAKRTVVTYLRGLFGRYPCPEIQCDNNGSCFAVKTEKVEGAERTLLL